LIQEFDLINFFKFPSNYTVIVQALNYSIKITLNFI